MDEKTTWGGIYAGSQFLLDVPKLAISGLKVVTRPVWLVLISS